MEVDSNQSNAFKMMNYPINYAGKLTRQNKTKQQKKTKNLEIFSYANAMKFKTNQKCLTKRNQ